MDMTEKSKYNITSDRASYLLILFACFVTNISQSPTFVSRGWSSMISTSVWMVCVLFVFLTREKRFPRAAGYVYGVVFLFFMLLAINCVFTGIQYWRSSHITCLLISIFVFTIGCLEGSSIGEREWHGFLMTYIISSGIVALEIFIKFFARNFNILSRVYAYSSKNSVSQILLTAVILLLFGVGEEYKIRFNAIRIALIAFLSLLILVLKSRATIICFGILYIAFLKNPDFSSKLKAFSVVAIGVLVAAIFLVPSLNEVVIKGIILAGRDVKNLNDLSSGRVNIIRRGLDMIMENPAFGIGKHYLDCYPVAVMLQFGIPAGIVLCVIAALPLLVSLKIKRENDSPFINMVNGVLIVLSISDLINGLFEALTPLGPGAKCYSLWLIFGIATRLIANDIVPGNETGVSHIIEGQE